MAQGPSLASGVPGQGSSACGFQDRDPVGIRHETNLALQAARDGVVGRDIHVKGPGEQGELFDCPVVPSVPWGLSDGGGLSLDGGTFGSFRADG